MANDDDETTSDHDETSLGGDPKIDRYWLEFLMKCRSASDQDLSEIRDRYLKLDVCQRAAFRRMIEGLQEHAQTLHSLGFIPGWVVIHFGPKLDRTGSIEIIAGLVAEQLDEWESMATGEAEGTLPSPLPTN